jgi:hypothetical protein
VSINTRVRFLEPIDPRAVFAFASGLVEAGGSQHFTAGSEPMYPGDHWPLNPRIRTTGDSEASIKVEYGTEGSALIEEWEAYPQYAEDYPLEQRGPRAYVLLDIESSGGYRYEDHPTWLAAIVAWSPVPVSTETD